MIRVSFNSPGLFLCSMLWAVFLFAGYPQLADAQCTSDQKPDVLLLLDQSGSVNNDKVWDTSVCNVVNSFQGKLRFGLMTFSKTATLQFGIADNNATNICNYLNGKAYD